MIYSIFDNKRIRRFYIMKNSVFFIYLLILAGSTYLIRVIPFIAIKEKINQSIELYLLFLFLYS